MLGGSHAGGWAMTDRVPTDEELSAAVTAAIKQWKRTRQLPCLSSSTGTMLNQLFVAGLHTVLVQRAEAGERS